jgi:6-phosphogluconolactonase
MHSCYKANKAEAVKHILEDKQNIELYPAQIIVETSDGDLHWFLDEGAASKLENK